MAKHLAQIIITGAQIVGRAFAKALRQEIAASQAAAARAGGGARGAEHSAANVRLGMTIEEAKQILNVEELTPEKIQENFDYLFKINEKTSGGTLYLQSKVRRNGWTLSHRRATGEPPPFLSLGFGSLSQGGHVREFSSFQVTWDTVLSQENRSRCAAKLKDLPSLRISKKKEKHSFSAVLVPLCRVEGELALLYTLRTHDLRSHRREVSFPGGKADPEDATAVETALRETEEEIGIPRGRVDVWGSMPPQPGKDGSSSIVGVLGYVGDIEDKMFSLNEEEVETVFAVTLDNLCRPGNCRQTQFRSKAFQGGYTLPIFVGSEPKIWGLTAIFTHLTLSALLPGIYRHRLYHVNY